MSNPNVTLAVWQATGNLNNKYIAMIIDRDLINKLNKILFPMNIYMFTVHELNIYWCFVAKIQLPKCIYMVRENYIIYQFTL